MRIKLDPLDSLFSKYIKLRAGGICQYCGQKPAPRGYHTHHFIGRRYLNTRFEPANAAALCMACHNLMGDFPRISQAFFVERVGSQRAEELEIVARTYNKMTQERREKIGQSLRENINLLEGNFEAYQSYKEKPARVEISVFNDSTVTEDLYGQVNPCKFGDQCEGHVCYCNNPNAYRKCHCSDYYGEKDLNSKCEFYEPNPYWQDGDGDFYEQREKTLLYLKSQGLLEVGINIVNMDAPEHYKGRKSRLLEDNNDN